ncbi:MAG: hypothetical protein JW846_01520 [Dehalococcoidia bacterium]|nr:hypothetical protein [Dehalococcoidia bacterium]
MSTEKQLRDFQRQEQRRISDLESSGLIRSTNWFGRHLNLTMGIGLAVYFVLGFGALARPFVHWFGSSPLFWPTLNWVPATIALSVYPTGQVGDHFANVSNVIFLGIPVLLPTWWALRQKRRSVAWLLALVVPFGWIASFLLKERPLHHD